MWSDFYEKNTDWIHESIIEALEQRGIHLDYRDKHKVVWAVAANMVVRFNRRMNMVDETAGDQRKAVFYEVLQEVADYTAKAEEERLKIARLPFRDDGRDAR